MQAGAFSDGSVLPGIAPQLWNLPESAKSVLQMVTFRLYMISCESQLSEKLTPKRSIPDRRSSDATWQAGCEGFAMSDSWRVGPAVMSAIPSLWDGKRTLRKPYSTSSL